MSIDYVLFDQLGIKKKGALPGYLFCNTPYVSSTSRRINKYIKIVQLQYPFCLALLTTKEG